MMDRRVDSRRKEFKKTIEDPRRKREDAAAQIRKQNREDHLNKKRQQALDETDEAAAAAAAAAPQPSMTDDQFQLLTQNVMSEDVHLQFEATQSFRRLLSFEKFPPIQTVIELGVVPRFVSFLNDDLNPSLQFEAAWVLTNIASGNSQQTAKVIECGAVPIFIRLLSSPKEEVREQAVWALGNISGDCVETRNLVLKSGGMQPILNLINQSQNTKIALIRNATWTLSNLCRGKPEPPMEVVIPALNTLRQLIYMNDKETLMDACWAFSYLTDASPDANGRERIDEVIRVGVVGRLVELLSYSSFHVQTPALRAIGNIVTGDDKQTQTVLMAHVLPQLLQLLHSPRKSLRKEAAWTVSNITAGNRSQVQEVINHSLVPPIIQLLETSDFDVQKEAAWAISNACSGGNGEQVAYLVQCGSIPPLAKLLSCGDDRVVTVCLEALENILRAGKLRQNEKGQSTNAYVTLVEEAGAGRRLEQLQYAKEGSKIHMLAMKIITEYFDHEVEDELSDVQMGQFGNVVMPSSGFNFQ